jgi:Fanconi anemia group M protein
VTQLLKTEQLESRAYQEVIAASASKANTMVVLPTGLGKTVIAAMVASRKLQEGKVLFLAPTRPLVEQHLSTFDDLLEMPRVDMKIMTGSTRPKDRYELWQNKRMFFATPQVVENDLIADEIPVEDFSLIIFDECHRATGDYAYNFISDKMKGVQRMALTASPGGGKEQIMKVADNLGIDNFEVRTEEDPDVEPYIQEKDVNWNRVPLDNRFESAKKKMEDAKRTQLKKLKSLGQIDSVSNVQKKDLLKLRGKISSQLSSTDDPKKYSAISRVATALKISQAIELLETQGVSQCYEYIESLENDDSKAAGRALEDEDMVKARQLVRYLKKKGEEHPKLDELRDILGEMGDDEKALVFTEYRNSTEKIAEELATEGLETETFVGQRGEKGMTQKEQVELLEEFGDGDHQVLVSTSIGEEGLDIPAVDYVIFYEPVPSAVRDIQRSGRTGREEAGEVHVLIAENTRDEGYYWSAHHKKKKMDKVLQELKQETTPDDQKKLESFSGENKAEKIEERGQEEEEDEKLEVVADDRENSVAKKLSRMEITVHKKRLDVADFLVSDRAAVERKQAEDFVDSIVDQRLFQQIQELHQFDRPIIIVEGEGLYGHRDVHPNAIRGAMASVAVDHEIPIIWSEDNEDTAELLKSLAKREQEEEDREVSVRGNKATRSQEELQKFVIAGLPGVNSKIAERLLDEFGTVRNVMNATDEELKEVQGIGDKKSKTIRELLEAEYE